MVFLAGRKLLQTPNLINRYNKEDAYFISLLSAILWAVNPIQIQAVTYIVQRMASMAAMSVLYFRNLFLYQGTTVQPGENTITLLRGMLCQLCVFPDVQRECGNDAHQPVIDRNYIFHGFGGIKSYTKVHSVADGCGDRGRSTRDSRFKKRCLRFSFQRVCIKTLYPLGAAADRTKNPFVLYQPDLLSTACQAFHNTRHCRFNIFAVPVDNTAGNSNRSAADGHGSGTGKKKTVAGFFNFILFY